MADEQTKERGHAPIALPAASFELTDIERALDSAISVKDEEKHPERINKAIAEACADPSVIANQDRPAVPTGAKLTDQETVYVEGGEPVKSRGPVFQPVDADDGMAATEMHYKASETDKGDVEVVGAEGFGIGIPDADADAAPTNETLVGAAKLAADETEDTTKTNRK